MFTEKDGHSFGCSPQFAKKNNRTYDDLKNILNKSIETLTNEDIIKNHCAALNEKLSKLFPRGVAAAAARIFFLSIIKLRATMVLLLDGFSSGVAHV